MLTEGPKFAQLFVLYFGWINSFTRSSDRQRKKLTDVAEAIFNISIRILKREISRLIQIKIKPLIYNILILSLYF